MNLIDLSDFNSRLDAGLNESLSQFLEGIS